MSGSFQLDTSKFSSDDEAYDYDSQPYFSDNPPEKAAALNEALVKDIWGLDYRKKLAEDQEIGKTPKSLFFKAKHP